MIKLFILLFSLSAFGQDIKIPITKKIIIYPEITLESKDNKDFGISKGKDKKYIINILIEF